MTDQLEYLPKVSIITVCLNNAAGLEHTIRSVINQSYKNKEHIIIDGGSKDGTLDVIRKYEHKIHFWVSEPDQGISDAFNKGLRKAAGDFVAFLNSDDRYMDSTAIETLIREGKNDHVIYGGIQYRREYHPVVLPKPILNTTYWLKSSIPHQASLTSRRVFQKVGEFDLKLKYCMDYFFYYQAYLAGFKFKAVPKVLTEVGCGGVSARLWKKQLDEIYLVQIMMGAPLFSRVFHYYRRFFRMFIYYNLAGLKILR